MKKLLSLFTALFFMGSIFIPVAFLNAASETVKLELIAPTTTRVGEAIDVTVKAIDKDGKTVTSYRGSIIFNTDNIGDTVPSPGKTITFTADMNGEKTFSKGLIFKKSGKQKLYVSDISEDIIGEITINVDPEGSTTTGGDQTITIITPENGTKIAGETVMVSGKTRKNSKISLTLNGQDAGTVISDESGIFTKNITGITQENNILLAKLLDGSNAPVATSSEIKFGRQVSNVATYGVTISPSSTVEVSSPIDVTVDATPGLSELTISLDGSILTTKETTSGKYTISTIAPQNAGTYKISISQKDALGQAKTTESETILTTTPKPVELPILPPPSTFKNIKTVTTGSKVVFDFGVENAPTDLAGFKIAFGTNADSLTQEVSTYTLDRIASPVNSGAYTWYINKIPEGTYTFKIFGRTQSGTLISGLVSEPIIATLGKDSCTIANVGGLVVDTDTSKSVISWTAIPEAVSYNLYKITPAGDYTLFQNTKEAKYTLFLSKGAVMYENFAVKALCDESTESKEYSTMSRVQSGPGMIAVLVIISAILGAFLMRRRYI
ncbi:hypothetical protein HOO68_01070 [Candidatus Gracilibacteria bacterium]|nr:hypothetical protein [Candidatus Gracilibacteria bacterium]